MAQRRKSVPRPSVETLEVRQLFSAATPNLTVSALSSTSVNLSWTESLSGAVNSFTIERQAPTDTDDVYLATVSSRTRTYVDKTVQPGTAYSYIVIANESGTSDASLDAYITTPGGTVVNPWKDVDIGSVGKAGSDAMSVNGTVTVNGGGASIGSTADAFNFSYQPLVGNGVLVTRVTSQTNTSSAAESGIMIRETTNTDSRYVLLALTPGDGVIMQSRTSTHVAPSYSKSVAGSAGVWLKLMRDGSVFTGYLSTDGLNFTEIGSVNITMVNNVLAGFCVTATNNSALSQATFSSTSLTVANAQASAWTDGATSPMDRWESETFTYNGRLYLFGGFIDRNLDATSECDVYDPSTNQWSYLTNVPTGALSHASVAVVGDIVYLAGGDLGTFKYGKTKTSTSEVLTYNLSTNQWGSITSLPTAQSCGGLAAINNHLYYYGGLNSNDTADLTNTWAIDLANTKAGWTAKAAMPDGRNHIGSVVINNIAYAVGGGHLYNETKGNDATVDAYNPATNKWTQVASMPMPWASNETTTLVANGKIVVIGGQTNGGYDGIYLSTIEEYNPSTNKWSSPGNLPEANEGESAAYIDGTLIVADGTVDNLGGWSQDQTWLDSEIEL
jgi:N-acetylneuraminic acid mutarotase